MNLKTKLAMALMSGSLACTVIPTHANVVLQQQDVIQDQINQMTIEQKIGQMIMPDFRQWKGVNDTKNQNHTVLHAEVAAIIDYYDLGGVILFAENVRETKQTTTLVHDLQEVVRYDESNDIPLYITIDQEGGIVTRLGTGTNLPGNMAIGATRSKELAYKAGKVIGEELAALGINVNFAPVLDVNNNPANPVIGVRSISSNPSLVGELGSQIINGIQDQGVAATAKHFPGHGDTGTDSHYGLPIVDKSLAELMKNEFLPFKQAIDEGLDIVMTGHIALPQIDDSNIITSSGAKIPMPATLSKPIIKGVLRDTLNFDGIVVTDALNMKAITENFSEADAVIKTFEAGVDIALMPTILRNVNDVKKLDEIIKAVVSAVLDEEDERLQMSDIDESVYRILKVKKERGIWNPEEDVIESLDSKLMKASQIVGSPEHKAIEKEIAEAAVTLVKNENHMLPFKPKANDQILVIAPAKDQVDSMVKSVHQLHNNGSIKAVGVDSFVYNSSTGLNNPILLEKIMNANYIIVGSNVSNNNMFVPGHSSYWNTSVVSNILNVANDLGKSSVLLSLRNPYDIANHEEAKAQVVVYGFKGDPNGPDSESGNTLAAGPNIPAGIGAIFGDFKPLGQLPVDVPVYNQGIITSELHLPYGYGFKNWNK